MKTKIQVFMVDDNKDVVTEVKKYFSSKNVGVEIVGSCSNGEDALIELKKNYEADDRGLRISYLGDAFKLTTKQEHKEYYQKLVNNGESNLLSPSALEVLAIIAYNEPITRMQIDEYRGVDSIYVLRRLLAKGLVKECGRSDLPGRPILYKTTDEFLDYFNLSSKDDLPKIELLEENDEEKDLYTSNYKE